VCWDRWLSLECCSGTDSLVWSGVLGLIVECGAVCYEGISVEIGKVCWVE